jgi:hypothetical protein
MSVAGLEEASQFDGSTACPSDLRQSTVRLWVVVPHAGAGAPHDPGCQRYEQPDV